MKHLFLELAQTDISDGQDEENQYWLVGDYFIHRLLDLHQNAENEFSETSNTMKHRFLDVAQTIFIFYKKQKRWSPGPQINFLRPWRIKMRLCRVIIQGVD
jgi:hypothetical protein